MNFKTVFTFEQELKDDPKFLEAIQAATLDPEETVFGLKGTNGLLGTDEWWANTKNGVMRSFEKVGTVEKLIHYDSEDAEDSNDRVPSFEMDVDGGHYEYHQCFVNDPADLARYKVGARVRMVGVLDEGKSPDEHGQTRYIELVLEVAVSD